MRLTKFILLIITLLSLNTAIQAQRRPNPDAAQAEVLITEFRPSGPNGTRDEYIELYNNTNVALDITGYTIYSFDGDGRTLFIAPIRGDVTSGFAVIPPRGFYLIANFSRSNTSATDRYSLYNYAVPNFSVEDRGANVDYFRNSSATPDPGNDVFRIAGVGFGTPDIPNSGTFFDTLGFQGRMQFGEPLNLGEGNLFNLPTSLPSPAPQYAVVRRFAGGVPIDTNDNANDFVLVSAASVNGFSRTEINGTFPVTAILGAPGPQSTTSPYRGVSNPILPGLLDPTRAANASPNVDRYLNEVGPNASMGTLAFRRRITNTEREVTNVRFRFVNLTTLNSPNQTGGAPQADGRVLSSGGRTGITRTESDGTQSAVTLTRMTLDAPPSNTADGNGGGLNSTLQVVPQDGVISLGSGSSLDVEFLFGINSPRATFRFAAIIETLPVSGTIPSGAAVGASSVNSASKARTGSRIKR